MDTKTYKTPKAFRAALEARLADRTFAKFHVDVAIGDAVLDAPVWVKGSPLLDFAAQYGMLNKRDPPVSPPFAQGEGGGFLRAKSPRTPLFQRGERLFNIPS